MDFILLLISTFLFELVIPRRSLHELHSMFSSFQVSYNKSYPTNTEKLHRLHVFINNVNDIDDFNSQNNSYRMGVNMYADWSDEEFKKRFKHMDQTVLKRSGKTFHNFTGQLRGRLPNDIDWVVKGKVSSVKDQKYCGGCWAFAVADAVESRYAITHRQKLIELSIQELIDCDHNGINEGCIGGNLPEGYDYVIDRKGLCTRHDYTFKGYDQSCKASKCRNRIGEIVDYGIVIPNNEEALRQAVAQGPVAAAIEADAKALQFYESGVLKTDTCGKNVDHAVTIVGYGVDKGMKYWKIKNSWSSSWGESGYMRICRECGRNGHTGECGITVECVFPIV